MRVEVFTVFFVCLDGYNVIYFTLFCVTLRQFEHDMSN